MTPEDKAKLKAWKQEQRFPKRKPLTAEEEAERHKEWLQIRRKQMTPLEQVRFCKKCNRNEIHVYRDWHMHCYKCWTMNCGVFHPCHCDAGLDEDDHCMKCGESHWHLRGLFDD